jgi:hypothetical protein
MRLAVLVAAGTIGITVGDITFQAARAAENAPLLIRLTAEQDHQRIKDPLHITELRHGRNGSDRNDPIYANLL